MAESFDWTYPGLDWSQFHSLANLLSLRNGGQTEPLFLSDVVLEDDCNAEENDDGYAPSMYTHLAHQISSSGHGKLKQRFLDCLAEFAANKKGGKGVACTAIEEAEGNVVVWIARNNGFEGEDHVVFEKLGKLLSLLADNDGTSCFSISSLKADVMFTFSSRSIE
jgi:hypothetical protein